MRVVIDKCFDILRRGIEIAVVAWVGIAGQGVVTLAKEPIPFIFDTDIGNDVDDVLAMGVIHSLQSRGELNLLAVTITKDAKEAAPFVDALNTFYGKGDIPIGIAESKVTPEKGKFLGLIEAKTKDGAVRYPHDLTIDKPVPSAVEVLRRTLANAKDKSVVIAQVGFSTNLAALLDSVADDISPLTGLELAEKKVRLLSVMAGAFIPIDGNQRFGEYNVVQDLKAAQTLAQRWPSPIVYSGFEIGIAVPYPAESIVNDYQYVEHHPLAESYVLYEPPPHNRPTWDLTSVLYAIYPDRKYFDLSEEGRVEFSDDGATIFKPKPGGNHRYLKLSELQKVRVIEALVQLSSQPPVK